MVITSINATAFYDGDEELGTIVYQEPFEVPPGISQTPRLPVELNLGGIGYSALKRALGGTLAIDAVAEIGLSIRNYRDLITFRGDGITAKVRI